MNAPSHSTPPPNDLVIVDRNGMYCPAGDFHIDPWAPVRRAVITHGHGDHARIGMGEYHTVCAGLPILEWRLGGQNFLAHEYDEKFQLGGVNVSLHPAGHVLGSAQVRLEHGGRVWVISGDYKRQPDPTCARFVPVRCDTFVTEATFALPIYRWPPTAEVVRDIVAWVDECRQLGEVAILYCYALGKAQRLLAELSGLLAEPVLLHGALETGVDIYRRAGVTMAATEYVGDAAPQSFAGRLVLAPPSAAGSPWLRRFKRAQQGFASGWMAIRGNRRRRNFDRGFVISDHVDWPDLLRTIGETDAREVIAMHGYSETLARFLDERGTRARTFTTEYGEDD